MEIEEDEEGSSSLLALSGTLMSQSANSTTPSLPSNSRQSVWLDIQTSDLSGPTSSFTRAVITSANSSNFSVSSGSSGNYTHKAGALSCHYYDDRQSVECKETLKYNSQHSDFNIRNDKNSAGKNYMWREGANLTVHSRLPTSASTGLSPGVQATRNVTTAISSASNVESARLSQGSVQNKMHFKKRSSDFHNSSSGLLYNPNTYLTSGHDRNTFHTGAEVGKTYNTRPSQPVHSLSAICPADSSCEPNRNLHVFAPEAALDSTRSPGQISSSDNHIQHFLKSQMDQAYTPISTPVRPSKKPPDSHEVPLTFDQKQMDGPDSKQDFDFSFGSRSFGSLGFATDFSSQTHSRGANHHIDYYSIEAAQSDLPAHTFFTASNSTPTGDRIDNESNFCIPETLNSISSKKGAQGYDEFETSDVGEDLRIVEQPQRKASEETALSSTLEASLPGSYMVPNDDLTNFRHQAINSGNQMSLTSQVSSPSQYKKLATLPEENNSWMGRSRAHRKMARLLGTADMSQKHGSSNVSKPINSLSSGHNTTEFHHKNTPEQDNDGFGRDFQPNHANSMKDQYNLSRDFLTLEDEFNFKSGGNNSITSRNSDDTMQRQNALNRELFLAVSSASTTSQSFMYQGSTDHSLSEGTIPHREPELPMFTAANSVPRDQALTNLSLTSVPKNLLDPDFAAAPIHKDSVVPGFLMNNQQGALVHAQQAVGVLDFTSAHRDLDLSEQFAIQDPKDFEMNPGQISEHQMDLSSFDQEVANGQTDLTLSDNLTLGSHGQQVLNLDAYFNPQPSRDLNMSRKLPGQHGLRDIQYLTNGNDFSFDDYMNPPTQRDASSSYLMQPNIPQDMTICQKPIPEKMHVNHETLPKQIQRQPQDPGVLSREEVQEGEMSELHKELTKTSSKESMKGIRIPRDINRAMEILQSLQADEKEEQLRKEQDWKRQQQQQHQQLLQQQQDHQHQQHQEQVQQMQQQHQQQMQLEQQQGQGSSLNSSPKKTFQNKHYFESLHLAMTEQQLLGATENLMDDQTVGNFLDQSQLDMADQSSDSLQMIQSFQALPGADSSELDNMTTGQYAKRDLSQPLGELDYHILKRLALATSLKDSVDQHASLTSMTNQSGTTNESTILTQGDINAYGGNQDCGIQYNTPLKEVSHFQRQGDFEDVLKESLSSKSSQHNTGSQVNQTVTERSRSDAEFPFADLDIRHHVSHTQQDSSKPEAVNLREVTLESSQQDVIPLPQAASKGNVDSLVTSRRNMFTMMKTEKFCDAVLSTPNQTVKVHQVVLCSMSHYLSSLLHKMGASSQSSTSRKTGAPGGISTSKTSPQAVMSESTTGLPQHSQSMNEFEYSAGNHQHSQGKHQQGENVYLSQHTSVLLVVNSDDIKASSLQTFLVYIYLGKSDLTEANVCDLYLLASSLRVNCLRDKCREFMQQEHIPEDKLQVPELVLSSSLGGRHFLKEPHQGERMVDKACGTADDHLDFGGQKMCDDKAVNTVGGGVSGARRGGHMEAATQTDRSTHEAGVRGSQEEWVMLKKTKQKTVSPSKSKSSFALLAKASSMLTGSLSGGPTGSAGSGYGPHGKSQTVPDSLSGPQYQHIHKLGKKGWLSPKRRYKTELHQMDGKVSSSNGGASKELATPPAKYIPKVFTTGDNCSENSPSKGDSSAAAKDSAEPTATEQLESDSLKASQVTSYTTRESEESSPSLAQSQSASNVTFPIVVTKDPLVSAKKTTRTTVEIAAEAAAAKVCAHSYGTRTARGAAKNPVSYAVLASGNSRKKSPSSTSGAAIPKKKAFMKTSPQADSQSNISVVEGGEAETASKFDEEKPGMPNFHVISGLTRHPLKKNIVHRSCSNEAVQNEENVMPGNISSLSNQAPESCGQTSTESTTSEVKSTDKAEGHIDNGSNNSVTDSEVHKISRKLEAEETSQTSQPQSSSPQNTSVLELTSQSLKQTHTSATPHAEPPPAKPVKAVPQNFRKRLIHQLNSEQRTKAICSQPAAAEMEKISLMSSCGETSSSLVSHPVAATIDQCLPTITKTTGITSVTISPQTSSVMGFVSSSSQEMIQSSIPDLPPETRPSPSMDKLSTCPTQSKTEPSGKTDLSVSSGQSKDLSPKKLPRSSPMVSPVCNEESITFNASPSISTEIDKSSSQTSREDVLQQGTSESGFEHELTEETERSMAAATDDGGQGVDGSKNQEAPSVAGTDQSEEQAFTHKIFKRKKKVKPKKLLPGETDAQSAAKVKKSSGPEGETLSVKSRHRKAAGGSDTEGSGGRPKVRKVVPNGSSSNSNGATGSGNSTAEGDGSLPKVRAPPKKRAKMELALLKAANLARRAIEERKAEPVPSSTQQRQMETEEQLEQGEEQSSQQEPAEVEKGTGKTGVVTEKVERRNLMKVQQKVAKRKGFSLPAGRPSEKVKAKDKVKGQQTGTSSVSLKKKKVAKSQPSSTKMKPERKRKTSDAAALMISSLTLKLKAKFKQYTLSSAENSSAGNDADGNDGTTVEDGQKEGATIECFSCNLCQVRLKSARRMVKHVRTHEVPDEKVVDTVCVGKFNQEFEACNICGYETKDKSYHYMHYHKYFRHGIPLPQGWRCDACKICGRVCATAFQFKEHMLSHEQQLKFICQHCGQHFSSRSNFNSHVYHKHSEVRKHQCTVCDKSFKTRTQLKVHVRSHTGERPFRCPDCDYGSTTRGNMKAHLKSHNYTSDKINQLIVEIGQRASELDAKSVDRVMQDIAEKVKKGELSATKEKGQDSGQPDKDGNNKKKQPKSKTKMSKPEQAASSVCIESVNSTSEPATVSKPKALATPATSGSVSEPAVTKSRAQATPPTSGGSDREPAVTEPGQESHIKRLLTAPLSSLSMPVFTLDPPVIEKLRIKLDSQRDNSDHSRKVSVSEQQQPRTEFQEPAEKETIPGTASSQSKTVVSADKGSDSLVVEKTESKTAATDVPSIPSTLVNTTEPVVDENLYQAVVGTSELSEPPQVLQQLPFSSSSSALQPSQPLVIPLVSAGMVDQNQQTAAAVATQQLQLPVQLFISPDYTGGGGPGVLEVQHQPILHTLPPSVGNLQVFSGCSDIGGVFAASDYNQALQAMSSVDTQSAVNVDGSQIIQVLASDASLTFGGSLGVPAQNGLPQIIQLVGAENGGLPAANVAAPGFLQLPVQSNFLESQCLFQEMVGPNLLPVITPGASVVPGLQDSGTTSGTTVQMSLSTSGEELIVHQVPAVDSQQTQQQQAQVEEETELKQAGLIGAGTESMQCGQTEDNSDVRPGAQGEQSQAAAYSTAICKEENIDL